MTARELKERGAQTLADALALIPEVQVRQGGMGIRVDVRGAKQFSVLLLVDGVPVDRALLRHLRRQLDPGHRHRRDPRAARAGVAARRARAATAASSRSRRCARSARSWSTAASSAARRPTAKRRSPAARRSATQPRRHPRLGRRAPRRSDLPGHRRRRQPRAASPTSQTHYYGSLRVEYGGDRGRFTGDVFYGHRSFYIPPSDTTGNLLQHITAEDSVRLVAGGELERHGCASRSASTASCSRAPPTSSPTTRSRSCEVHQDLLSGRFGGAVHVDRRFARARPARHALGAPLRRQRRRQRAPDRRTSPDGAPAPSGALARSRRTASSPSAASCAGAGSRPRRRSARSCRSSSARRRGPTPRSSSAFIRIRMLTHQPHRRAQGAPADDARADRSAAGQPPTAARPSRPGTASCSSRCARNRFVAARFSGYVRRIDGLIRLDPTTDARRQPRHHRRARPRDRHRSRRAIASSAAAAPTSSRTPTRRCPASASTPSPTFRAIASTSTSRRRGSIASAAWCASTGSPSASCSRRSCRATTSWSSTSGRASGATACAPRCASTT